MKRRKNYVTQGERNGEDSASRPRGRSRRGGGKGQKETIKLGAWNVRTMYWRPKLKKGKMEVLGGGLGKEEILCSELTRKQIGIGAYSEHRWPGKGEFQHGEYCFLFTGASEEDIPNPAHRGGAGIVMNKEITNAWRNSGAQVEFKSTRILGIRFKHKGAKYNVISVYAPTFMRRA